MLAEHLGIEQGKPRLLLVSRDFEPDSERARELLPLRQRCLVCFDCSDPERSATALAALAAQLALTTTEEPPTEEPPTECPYPGLRMFGEGDPGSFFPRTDLFFGRDQEGREIVEKLRDDARVLLVGPSGCGKSSLMRARVLPALCQGTNAMVTAATHPGTYPDVALRAALDALDARLGPAIDAYLDADDKQAALAALQAITAGTGRLLYVDQLEEVFLDDADESGERARFFARLAALGRVPGVAILLGMRADFYGNLMRSPAWDEFKDHRVELTPLRGAALRQAITRPAEMVGVHVEADLVERLVREADLDRAAEALPLLQVALEQLWAQREWRYLSLASYARIAEGERRGLDVVFARHADDSIDALAEPMRVLARRVLIDLVHLGEGRPDTRRRRTASELRRADDDGGALTQVLDHLSARRLITVGAEFSATVQVIARLSADGKPEIAERHVDLAHDTLITGWPALAGWLSERRDDLRTQRRLEARASGGGLLAVSELPEFTRWVAWINTPAGQALGATDMLRSLVRRSVAARRLRLGILGIGFAAAVAFALMFGRQTVQLREEKTKTQVSISKAAETAKLIVFEIDRKLRTVAGASPVRDTLLKSSRDLLADLRKLGALDERDQRTAMLGKKAQGDFVRERGYLEEARVLYLEVLEDAQRRAATDPANAEWQGDLTTSYISLGDVAVASGKLVAARGWFEQALAVSKLLFASDRTNTAWQRDLSLSYERLGDVSVASGKLDAARGWFEQALTVRRALTATDLNNTEWQRALLVSYDKLGGVATASGKLDAARGWFEQALAGFKALAIANPANAEWQHHLVVSYERLGAVAVASGKLEAAREWFEQALTVSKALADADPANTAWQRTLAVSFERLGSVAVASGKLDVASGWYEQVLAVLKALAAVDPVNTDWQRDVSVSYERLGDVAKTSGKLDVARKWYEQALVGAKALAVADPANADWQRGLALSYIKLGDVTELSGKLDAARGWYEQALAVNKVLVAADPVNTAWQQDLSMTYDRLGNLAEVSGKLDTARDWYEQALSMRRVLAAADLVNTEWQRALTISYNKLGDTEVAAGKLDAARKWFEQALAVSGALATADPANAEWQRDLLATYGRAGDVAVASGKLDAAQRTFQKALTLSKKLTAADPANAEWQGYLAVLYERFGDMAKMSGKLDAARGWYEQALTVSKTLAAADPTNTALQRDHAQSFNKLGNVAVATSKLDAAREWYEQALTVIKRLVGTDPANAEWQRDLGDAYNKLSNVAEASGKRDDAQGWLEQALAVSKTLAAANPTNTRAQRDLLILHFNMAALLTTQPERAASHLKQAAEIYEQLRGTGAFSEDRQLTRIHQQILQKLRGRRTEAQQATQ